MYQWLQTVDCEAHFFCNRVGITEKLEGFDKSQSVVGGTQDWGELGASLSFLVASYGSQFKSLASFISSPFAEYIVWPYHKPRASFTHIKLFSSPSLLASPLLRLCILFCLPFGCLIQRTSILNKAQHLLFCTLTPTPTLLSRPQFPHLSNKRGTWRKHFYVLFSIPPFYVFLPRP